MARNEVASARANRYTRTVPHKICLPIFSSYVLNVCASLFYFYLVCMSLAIWCSPLETH